MGDEQPPARDGPYPTGRPQAEPLSSEQEAHFLEHGYLKLENCFDADSTFWQDQLADMWRRAGFDEHDRSTWPAAPWLKVDRTVKSNWHDIARLSPRLWSAVCELLGGADRLDPDEVHLDDGWALSLGSIEQQEAWGAADADERERLLKSDKAAAWHADGDDFCHYLDSPDLGLVVLTLHTNVVAAGGPTLLATDSIARVAKHLLQHPEGVRPDLTPLSQPPPDSQPLYFYQIVRQCENFVAATGKAGDAYILHPLMVHSQSPNYLRRARVIKNGRVSLKAPFQLRGRKKGDRNFCLVERKTLMALGVSEDAGLDWEIDGQRKAIDECQYRLF